MATSEQLKKKLADAMSTKVGFQGIEPPRLVRANSAFSKRATATDGRVVEA